MSKSEYWAKVKALKKRLRTGSISGRGYRLEMEYLNHKVSKP